MYKKSNTLNKDSIYISLLKKRQKQHHKRKGQYAEHSSEKKSACRLLLRRTDHLGVVKHHRGNGAGAHYEAGSCIAYGSNLVGDPQLYRVQQSHTAQADWAPDKTPSLFAPIGLGKDGIPLWAQPAGAHDAYCIGDTVEFDGAVYRSLRDGNIHSPAVYPEGWEALTTGG